MREEVKMAGFDPCWKQLLLSLPGVTESLLCCEEESLRHLTRIYLSHFLPSIVSGNGAGKVSKAAARQLHLPIRRLRLCQYQHWIHRYWPRFKKYFAHGYEVRPERIQPVLVEVRETWHRHLFRLARLTWSLPYSSGFGRRMYFLVFDVGNRGREGEPFLMGLLALQSPPLTFPARDRLFRYPEGRKPELINQTMDIHTLGALPPYNFLLGGKLIALIAASNEVRKRYREKYEGRQTWLYQRVLPPHLVALTTTSAFGRSSLYNRLKYQGKPIAISLGWTQGYGVYHLEPLYPLFRAFLEAQGWRFPNGYQTGPRMKWQICTLALERLGFSKGILKHNVRREAFLFPLIENLKAYMEGKDAHPQYRDLPLEDLVHYWKSRWLLPRAERDPRWRQWTPETLFWDLTVEGGENDDG